MSFISLIGFHIKIFLGLVLFVTKLPWILPFLPQGIRILSAIQSRDQMTLFFPALDDTVESNEFLCFDFLILIKKGAS